MYFMWENLKVALLYGGVRKGLWLSLMIICIILNYIWGIGLTHDEFCFSEFSHWHLLSSPSLLCDSPGPFRYISNPDPPVLNQFSLSQTEYAVVWNLQIPKVFCKITYKSMDSIFITLGTIYVAHEFCSK